MMQTDALLATTRRGDELRYVTEHFRDLQGLYLAWVWAGLLVLCFLRSSTLLSRAHIVIVAVSIVVLFLSLGVPYIHAWYERYGVVKSRALGISQSNPLSILEINPAPRLGASGLSGRCLGFRVVLLELVFSAAWIHTGVF